LNYCWSNVYIFSFTFTYCFIGLLSYWLWQFLYFESIMYTFDNLCDYSISKDILKVKWINWINRALSDVGPAHMLYLTCPLLYRWAMLLWTYTSGYFHAQILMGQMIFWTQRTNYFKCENENNHNLIWNI
jgi:hypothetical protein